MLNKKIINKLDETIVKPFGVSVGGANKKFQAIIDDETYILKFQELSHDSKWTSYTNSVFSEHIGCRIFESLGIPTQETYLCEYKNEIVVACKMFTDNDHVLMEMNDATKYPEVSVRFGRNPEIDDVYKLFKETPNLNEKECIERFWDVFVVDALLGNSDRHSGNFGFLANKNTTETHPSPVYDCASCLHPNIREEDLFEYLSMDRKKLKEEIFDFPKSVYKDESGQKIYYHEYLSSLKNEDCNNALLRIVPNIDLNEIRDIINGTQGISDLRKDFYYSVVEERYENILVPAYELLLEELGKNNKLQENSSFKDKLSVAKEKANNHNKDSDSKSNKNNGLDH